MLSAGVEKALKVSVLVTVLVRLNYISDLSMSVEVQLVQPRRHSLYRLSTLDGRLQYLV